MGLKKKAKKLTAAQLTKIWSKRDELGMPEEKLRGIVERVSGQRSTKELTRHQAMVVIDFMEGKSPVPKNTPLNSRAAGEKRRFLWPKKNPKVIGGFAPLATPKHLSLIENLKKEAGWDDEHLMNFVRKIFNKDTLDKLGGNEAGVLITVLKRAKGKRLREEAHVLS